MDLLLGLVCAIIGMYLFTGLAWLIVLLASIVQSAWQRKQQRPPTS